MVSGITSPNQRAGGSDGSRTRINPWLLISFTAPIPLLLLCLLFFNWYHGKADAERVLTQLIQRQNTTMAYDAMAVAADVSDFLEKAARDVHVLALVPPTPDNFRQFHDAQIGTITEVDQKTDVHGVIQWPFYNRIAYVDNRGQLALSWVEGKVDSRVRSLAECREGELCDHDLLTEMLALPVGQLRYGRVLRWYTPDGKPLDESGASLSVAYRAPNGVFQLGLDYRQLADALTTPTFPYQPKHNLLQNYQQGNYIYVVDNQGNVIVHPKYSNVVGIDRSTGAWVPPMKTDADENTHPINIQAYQGGKLKEYFDRLLKKSFVSGGVDIFQAPNLAGTVRVLSVAPIWLGRGQFKDSGVFGHVVVGVSLEHFQEPKEKIVPYY